MRYSHERTTMRGVEHVVLADADAAMSVRVVPALGNAAVELLVHGRDILWSPPSDGRRFVFGGVPVLWPWANRLAGPAHRFDGRSFELDRTAGGITCDANGLPIHGLVGATKRWRLVDVGSSADGAHVTSRLDFGVEPRWLASFPFPHEIVLTHRLGEGRLVIEARIANTGTRTMPFALGFHPHFRVHDAPRSLWRITSTARSELVLDERLLPNGARTESRFRTPLALGAAGVEVLLADLEDGATVTLEGHRERIEVELCAGFGFAVVQAAADSDHVCIEPMTASIDPFAMAERGRAVLPVIEPGKSMSATFAVRPES